MSLLIHRRGILSVVDAHLTAYAEAQGFAVAGIVSERGNGLDDSRTGLHEILKTAENGGADVLLVTNLSRLGRNSGKSNALLHRLRAHGVSVVCADGAVLQTELDIFDRLLNSYRSFRAAGLLG